MLSSSGVVLVYKLNERAIKHDMKCVRAQLLFKKQNAENSSSTNIFVIRSVLTFVENVVKSANSS